MVYDDAGQSEDIGHKRKFSPLGCFGWTLVLLGALFLAGRYWYTVWDWALFIAGMYFIYSSFRDKDKQMFFPGLILLITSGALVARKIGWVDFPDWHFWPILFGSIGLGFLTLWITKTSRLWSAIVGGAFLLVAGSGFGDDSFWAYQRHLRQYIDYLPLVLIIFGVVILFRFRRRKLDSSDSDN